MKEQTETKEVNNLISNLETQLPQLNINTSIKEKEKEEKMLVDNEKMVSIYEEILGYCREDRKDANEAFKTFMDMVINDGDATSSSKEAMVNFLKIRTEVSDKMTKVMDLLMRYVLKERDTFPKYLAANQENNIIVKTGKSTKRSLLETIEKMQKQKGAKDE